MPEIALPTPARSWFPVLARSRRLFLDCALVLVMGGAFFLWVGLDARSYLLTLGKPSPTYALNSPNGGVGVGPSLEFFRHGQSEYAKLENFARLESNHHRFFRHGLGPVCSLEIFTQSTAARLSFAMENHTPGQSVTVACNGSVIEAMSNMLPGLVVRDYALILHPGSNVVTFSYQRYNHDGLHDSADPRRIAGTFRALDVALE